MLSEDSTDAAYGYIPVARKMAQVGWLDHLKHVDAKLQSKMSSLRTRVEKLELKNRDLRPVLEECQELNRTLVNNVTALRTVEVATQTMSTKFEADYADMQCRMEEMILQIKLLQKPISNDQTAVVGAMTRVENILFNME